MVTILEGAAAGSPDAGDGWMRAQTTPDGAEVIHLDHVRYERDPVSAVFDDIDDDELDMLAANIKAEGQELPITINKTTGTVVDGWQRLRACHLIMAASRTSGRLRSQTRLHTSWRSTCIGVTWRPRTRRSGCCSRWISSMWRGICPLRRAAP